MLPKYSYEFDFDMNNPLSNSIVFKNIGYKFLESVYEDLGISQAVRLLKSRSKVEYDIDGILKMLVFNRILDPKSKKKMF